MREVLIECALVIAVVGVAAPGLIWWARTLWAVFV